MSKVISVGITGGIGAGKSIASEVFKLLGIPVYDADSRAKWLMSQDPELKAKIISLFGEQAYNKEGLDRSWLSNQTFYDKKKLEQLNQLVHPAVGEDYKTWRNDQQVSYTLKEAALLFEAGSYKALDKIIVVTAPLETRIRRVLQRDNHRSRKQVEAIISNQWPEEKKIKMANFVIKNGHKDMVLPQILAIHKELTQ